MESSIRKYLIKELQSIINDLRHVEDKSGITLSLFFNNIKIKGGITMVQLKDTQKVTGVLQPVDAKGNAAEVQAGSVTVTSSNEEVVTVVRNPDNELEFDLVAGKPGTAQVDFSADADLGEGVVSISGFTAVEVQAGQAVGFGASFAQPVEVVTPEA